MCVYGGQRSAFGVAPQELFTSHLLRQCYGYRYIPPCLAFYMGFVWWNWNPMLVQDTLYQRPISPAQNVCRFYSSQCVCPHKILFFGINTGARYLCRLSLDHFTHTSNLVINRRSFDLSYWNLPELRGLWNQKQVMNFDNSFDLHLLFEGFHFIWTWTHTEKYVASSERFDLACGLKRWGTFILPLEFM